MLQYRALICERQLSRAPFQNLPVCFRPNLAVVGSSVLRPFDVVQPMGGHARKQPFVRWDCQRLLTGPRSVTVRQTNDSRTEGTFDARLAAPIRGSAAAEFQRSLATGAREAKNSP